MVYPALLPLMRTPRLPVVDWTDAPRRFKWTCPFRRKTKSGFCACAITFQLASASVDQQWPRHCGRLWADTLCTVKIHSEQLDLRQIRKEWYEFLRNGALLQWCAFRKILRLCVPVDFLEGGEVGLLQNMGVWTGMFTWASSRKWKWIMKLGEHVTNSRNHHCNMSHNTFSSVQTNTYIQNEMRSNATRQNACRPEGITWFCWCHMETTSLERYRWKPCS